jgi:hypothetical protein
MRELIEVQEIPPTFFSKNVRDIYRPSDFRLKKKRSGKKPKKRVERPLKLTKQQRRDLNSRQRAALTNYIELGMGNDKKKQAGIEAGYSPTTAVSRVNNILSLASVQTKIQKALEDVGVSDEKIADVILEGLSAKHPLAPKQKDYHAISKFVHEANTLKANYPPQRIKVDTEQKILIVNISSEDAKALAKYQRMRGEDVGV